MIEEKREKINTIIILSFTFLFIFLMALSKNADYDIFFHLATGKQIVETGSINQLSDPFSLTTSNPMMTTSWLSGVVFYILNNVAGMEGLVVLKAIVITAVFFFMYKNIRTSARHGSADIYICSAVLIVAAYAVRMRMFVRPLIFELLLLSLYIYILNSYRHKGSKLLFALPFLQIIWVNVHPSSILGVALPFLFLVGEGIKYLFNWMPLLDKRGLQSLAWVAVVMIVASMVNPRGYGAILFPFKLTGQEIYMAHIDEWQPLKIMHLIGYGFRYTWGFSLLSLLTVFALLYQWRKTDLTEAMLFCLFMFLALRRVRVIPESVIVMAPIASKGLAEIISRLDLKKLGYKGAINGILIVTLSVVFYMDVLNSKTYAFGLGLKDRVFPAKAVDFLKENNITGNMYNSLGYGGYLMWRLYPRHKVFIDGRIEIYDERLYKDYLDAHSNPDTWKAIAERYDIDWVILEYSRDYAKKERMPHLVGNPDWALVYWDPVATVYVKRGPKNDDIIKRFEYRYARPSDLDFSYIDLYLLHEKDKVGYVIEELKKNNSTNPDNEESYMANAYINYYLGNKNEALRELKKAIEINPNIGFAYSSMGELYREMGDKKMAETAYLKALNIDPSDQLAIAGLKSIRQHSKR
ncbi:MAG: hypothetical protein HY786_05010 [Deltaproteobacteria bacterium]|nr:hypothetical protein [Deltaproteobacteria bacterium]